MASKKTDLDPAVVAEIASKSTKELEAATGMHARAIEAIRDAMAEGEDVIAAKAKYDEARAVYMTDEAFNAICDECNQATAQAEAERAAARAEADRKYRLAMKEIRARWKTAYSALEQTKTVPIERPARLGVQYDAIMTAQLTSEWRMRLTGRT